MGQLCDTICTDKPYTRTPKNLVQVFNKRMNGTILEQIIGQLTMLRIYTSELYSNLIPSTRAISHHAKPFQHYLCAWLHKQIPQQHSCFMQVRQSCGSRCLNRHSSIRRSLVQGHPLKQMG